VKETTMEHTTGLTSMIRSMAWDLGLPMATYYALHALGAGDTTPPPSRSSPSPP
jgi:hypothetical protein